MYFTPAACYNQEEFTMSLKGAGTGMQLDLDIEQFWRDEERAHEDNCFSEEAPQVALGIRMSDECVFAELGGGRATLGIYPARTAIGVE